MSKKSKKSSMPLSLQFAGMAASAVISLAVVTAILKQQEPMAILTIAIPAGILAGVIGYVMGIVMEKPTKPAVKDRNGKTAPSPSYRIKNRSMGKTPPAVEEYGPLKPITGDETFLGDLPPLETQSTEITPKD